jgi:hypothetical protein
MPVTYTYLEHLPKRPVSEADVAADERELGFPLPADVRAFALAHDGATPSPAWFSVPGPQGAEWHGPILYFLSTDGPRVRGMGRGTTFWATAWQFREDHKVPRHYLPLAQIATVTKENYLLVSVAAADYGTVYLWRAANKRFRPDQLRRAAGSLGELLGRLAEPPAEVRAENDRVLQLNHEGRFRPAADSYSGLEARRWLLRNRHEAPLAVNHFGSAAVARRFVDELYAAGATRVLVPEDHIRDRDDGGPYADALVVFLPAATDARASVCRRCQRELDQPEPFDANDPNPLFLWWD